MKLKLCITCVYNRQKIGTLSTSVYYKYGVWTNSSLSQKHAKH